MALSGAQPTATPGRPPLISLHLASNRPEQIAGFFENIERSVADPSSVEILVKIDDGDSRMTALAAVEAEKRPYAIRAVSSPREDGYFSLWKAYNALWHRAHPGTYFVAVVNDEVRFETSGWDTVLARYVGFWPDNIFRLRVSRFRLRNYHDLWECGFAPDAFAIHSRAWVAAGGDWAPCNTPDAFQQMVAWRLSRFTSKGPAQISRDIPIHDIRLSGETPGGGLTEAQLHARARAARRHWYRLVSPLVQTECARRARLIEAHIRAHEIGRQSVTVRCDTHARCVEITSDGAVLERLDYDISAWRLWINNVIRRPFHDYWCGGGRTMLEERWAKHRRDVEGWLSRMWHLACHRRSRILFFLRMFLDDPRLFIIKLWRRLSSSARR
ncbi:MAG: hypothetical protein ACYC1L_09705 [Alphaproteobacteria bacterium]